MIVSDAAVFSYCCLVSLYFAVLFSFQWVLVAVACSLRSSFIDVSVIVLSQNFMRRAADPLGLEDWAAGSACIRVAAYNK